MTRPRSGVYPTLGIACFWLACLAPSVFKTITASRGDVTRPFPAFNANVRFQFEDMRRRWPDSFEAAFGEPDRAAFEKALALGRSVYRAEGCGSCHARTTRERAEGDGGIGSDFASVSPRGPDLSRQGGRRSNDWLAVHFYRPELIVPDSPMPSYPWLFKGDPGHPNRRGLALLTFLQWQGSWLESYPDYEEYEPLGR